MKTAYLLAALLLTPAFTRAEDTAVPVPPVSPAAPAHAAPGPRAAAFRKHVLEKFDADKDGKLSDSERESAKTAWKEKNGGLHAKALEKFDEDKDGQLSDPERDKLKAALKSRRKGAGGDSEQDGGKHAERQRKMLEKFDADKDGQLNETERATAREARKTRPATGA